MLPPPPLKVWLTLCQRPSHTGSSAEGACVKASMRTTAPVLSTTHTLPFGSTPTLKGRLKVTAVSAPPLPPLAVAAPGVFAAPVTEETKP